MSPSVDAWRFAAVAQSFSVRGSSMEPALARGDRVFVEGGPVRIGDIAVMPVARHRLVVHRVCAIFEQGGETWVVARGDGAACADAPVRLADVVGVVRHVQRAGHGGRIIRRLQALRAWWARQGQGVPR